MSTWVLSEPGASLCYYLGDQCISRVWLHYSTIMLAHRDEGYFYPGDYISFDCVPDLSAVPCWCGGAMCLKGLSGGSHLHVEYHGLKFHWHKKCSCTNCHRWRVVNGVHLKWLPNKLWNSSFGVILLYLWILKAALRSQYCPFCYMAEWCLSRVECCSRISHPVPSLSIWHQVKKIRVLNYDD